MAKPVNMQGTEHPKALFNADGTVATEAATNGHGDTASETAAEIETMDIFAFMPQEAAKRVSKVVTMDGPPGFLNADGTRAQIQIRKLPHSKLTDIYKRFSSKQVVRNKKGRPETSANGRVAIMEDSDSNGLANAMIAEALVFPNMRDRKLAEAYGEFTPENLVEKVFNTTDAYTYIIDAVNDVNGLGQRGNDDDENEMVQLKDRAKN